MKEFWVIEHTKKSKSDGQEEGEIHLGLFT